MTKIYYGPVGGPTNRLIPAPFVTITKEYSKSGSGEIIGKVYRLTLNGTIVAYMGSPKSDGSFHTTSGYPANENIAADSRLASIQRKQEAIRYLFSAEGQKLEIQSADGSASVKCYPRVIDINFPEGLWYEKCEYTINLECDELDGGSLFEQDDFSNFISDASESWSIETNEEHAETIGVPKTYVLSHNVSANGKRSYNDSGLIKEAWEHAKTWVLSKLGYDPTMITSSGVLNLPSYYSGYNHSRGENTDQQGGSYSVTETWVLSSGNATETFSVRASDSLTNPYKVVNIEGTVTGYDQTNTDLSVLISKWTNAQNKFVSASGLAWTRAKQFSGYTNLNILPNTQTFGYNPIQGNITYDFEYDTRPINLIEHARAETITVGDNVGGDHFATVFVLGRTKGPVLQDLGTRQASVRTLNIELLVTPPTYSTRDTATIQDIFINSNPINNSTYSTDINRVIDAVNPINNGFSVSLQDQPQITWDAKNGNFSYSTAFTYEL